MSDAKTTVATKDSKIRSLYASQKRWRRKTICLRNLNPQLIINRVYDNRTLIAKLQLKFLQKVRQTDGLVAFLRQERSIYHDSLQVFWAVVSFLS